MYKDDKLMKILYSGQKGRFEKKRMEMLVEEDLEKTLHSFMARCGQNAKNKGVEKGNNNESENCPSASEGKEEEGYSSDMDLRKLLSRRWSRDTWKKSDKGDGTLDDNWGRKSEDEVGGGERRSRKQIKTWEEGG